MAAEKKRQELLRVPRIKQSYPTPSTPPLKKKKKKISQNGTKPLRNHGEEQKTSVGPNLSVSGGRLEREGDFVCLANA